MESPSTKEMNDGSDTPESTNESESRSNAITDEWPVIADTAFYGVAGDLANAIAPGTEADRAALLCHNLAEFSAVIGRGSFIKIDGHHMPLSFWPVLIGDTSKSRKGTADNITRHIYQEADFTWNRGKYTGSLSSAEGLIYAVRDQLVMMKNGKPVIVDSGVKDKRLLVVEAEFGSALKIMEREGNTLSGTVRHAWDGKDLAPMTKNSPMRATKPHIVIVGHVTKNELLRNLTSTEATNGFANRFVWIAVRRSQFLPFPYLPPAIELKPLIDKLKAVINFAAKAGEIGFTLAAKAMWGRIYKDLSEAKPGMAGSLLARSESQVRRLAALYAVLDKKNQVHTYHLQAALAVWQFSEKSVQMIFGNATGDRVADRILQELKIVGELSDTQIHALFSRNTLASRIHIAMQHLREAGYVCPEFQNTQGAKRHIWKLVGT